ncbi:hypothetical protein FEM48_Zijuj10G0098600 [Ziziphus jujuba var. spinosa]|uniref:Leucine-rich repeat-containing N-terminal plant-type domain-containing protein n=1 Tax=Ziziphus jujuba var. spinosa TaxID=714518 RepID=A0A978UMP4_ZIZJJ|nr:hypothetical protein FEM48_Zijuj10G0098600 [Ziziphus jujuba var. spinosa]
MKCHELLGKTVVFFFFIFFSCCVSVNAVLVSERLVLLELKASFLDPSAILSSWNSDNPDHHCSWFGVSCDSQSRVVSLSVARSGGKPGNSEALSCSKSLKVEFPFNGFGFRGTSLRREAKLRGKISPFIGELTRLRVLSLPYNDLSGGIPVEIWGLTKLEVLDLEGNLLTGKLPSRFTGLRKLRVLNLGSNRIYGEVPFSLSKCGSLEVLNLAGNAVNGTFPVFFGSLPKLQGLYFSQNRLTGNVPAEFGSNCWNLEHLDLSGNFLVGKIPDSLGNCRRLQRLLLFSNMLNGAIPRELSRLQMLEVLDVSRNNLSGPIPVELGQCVNLSVFVLSNFFDPLLTNQNPNGDSSIALSSGGFDDYNSFEGSLPMEITTLPNLKILWAPRVALGGKFPSNWGACENLEMVNLAKNLFKGEVFGVFKRCKKLSYLDLSSNKLTGKLDEKLPVPCMTVFDVSGNLMSGSIPRFNYRLCSNVPSNSDVIQIDSPSFPYKLFFTCKTHLEMHLPFNGNDSAVVHNFSNNNFTGPIKSLPIAQKGFGKQTIYAFLAGGNKLTGSFSESLFGKCDGLSGMILNVSNNRFSGCIPPKIGLKCRNLRLLDASGNEINGSIPPGIGDLTSLVVLDLSRNELQGQIPVRMSHLKYLKYISLADNNLTGTIPNQLGWLHSLEVLDLSSNSLSGEIPQDVVCLRNLTFLRLNNNKLCGKVPSRLASVISLPTYNVSCDHLSGWLPLNNNVMNSSGLFQHPFHIISRALSSLDQPENTSVSQIAAGASQPESVGNAEDNGLNSIEIASVVSASAIVLVLLALIVLFFYTRKWVPDSRVQGSELKEIIVFNNIGVQQFHAEVKTLGRVKHCNLVTLVGYHASETEMFLIYNYFPGGPHDDLVEMLYVAVTCTVETLSIRPTMRQVVQRLKRIQPS